MKRTYGFTLLFIAGILSLLSIQIPLIAVDSGQYSTTPLTLSTYSEYFKTFNGDEPLHIFYPRSSIPVIATPEQSFIIQFQSVTFDSISARITTAFNSLADTIEIPILSHYQENNITYATATIPMDVPQELYNLTLTIETNDARYSKTEPRSISVKNTISGSYSFIHLADFHIGDPRGLIENPQETIGWKAARKVIEEVNLLQPDFVIISGDLVFGQLYPFEYSIEYKRCYQILQEFDVPTFLCPGNHDGYIQMGQDGLKFWEEYFGPLYYSIDYADTHILSINSYDWSKFDRLGFSYIVLNWGGSIREEQMQWIAEDLTENSDAEHTMMMMHHNPLWDTTGDSLLKKGYQGREELKMLITTNGVDSVYAGHVHYDDVTVDNETTYITTTTLSSSFDNDAYWGYRLIKVEDNQLSSYNYKEPKYSYPSYHLNILEKSEQSITIENLLEKSVEILIEFIVPNEEYTVTNGSIEQMRIKEDMAAVYVSATIPEQTTSTITLS